MARFLLLLVIVLVLLNAMTFLVVVENSSAPAPAEEPSRAAIAEPSGGRLARVEVLVKESNRKIVDLSRKVDDLHRRLTLLTSRASPARGVGADAPVGPTAAHPLRVRRRTGADAPPGEQEPEALPADEETWEEAELEAGPGDGGASPREPEADVEEPLEGGPGTDESDVDAGLPEPIDTEEPGPEAPVELRGASASRYGERDGLSRARWRRGST